MRLFRRLLILWFFVFVFIALSHSKEIDMKSKTLEYDEQTGFVVAKSSVTIAWKDSVLTADEVNFYVRKKTLTAKKDVTLKDAQMVMRGDRLDYDYNKETGEMTNISGVASPWFFTAKKGKKLGKDRYELKGVDMSSCDYDKEDFHVTATTAKVKAGRRITTYNPVMYFRNTPIFYLPIFPYASGPHRDSLEIMPGYDNTDGFMCKVIYGYPFTDQLYGKLYLDYYGLRGIGEGGELIYKKPTANLDLYTYHILEQTTETERYNTSLTYWQRINPLWNAQAKADYLSDQSIINNYFLDTASGSNSTLHSFLTLTRQDKRSNLQITAERYDVYNPVTGSYDPTNITLPRLQYSLYPQRAKNGIYTTFSSYFQYQYLSPGNFYTTSANADTAISKDFRLGRKMTFKPSVGLDETWQDRSATGDFTDLFVTRYFTNDNLRYRLKNWIDWDFTYSYKIRAEQNQLGQDVQANDYGVESNQLSYVNSMYLGRTTIRNSINYNLALTRNDTTSDWRERFSPLTNQLTWAPPKNYYVYVSEQNSVFPIWSIQSAQAYVNWGRVETHYFNFGVFYNSGTPDNMDFVTGFGFWPAKKWRLDYSIRTTSVDRFSSWTVNDTEIKLFRNIHCWEFKISYKRRLQSDEIFFNIGLNSSTNGARKPQKEFNPW